jgi:hypothetical protein
MLLSDYYRQTVKENEDGKGWAQYYYGVFSKVIADNNYKVVAEVGIGYGTHAKYILNHSSTLERLYLIDPVQFYPNDRFATDIMGQTPIIPGNNFNELFELIHQELTPLGNRHTMFRVPSLAITNSQIADSTLDAVFVDGDHSYAAIRADLEFWWKKIRVGGQMLGDDFWMPDVAQAVNEFSVKYNVPYDLLTLPNNDYKIFRFHKTA